MAFKGDLESINLPDLLQLLSSARKTGALSIRRGTQEKRLYFRDGMLVYASSTEEHEKLGNVLVREGLLQPRDVEKGREHQATTGRRFGLSLLEQGSISHTNLVVGLKTQARMIITNLFQWWGGHFDFLEEGINWPKEITVGFDVQAIILDAATAVDEWNKIRDSLPDLDVILEIAPAPAKGSAVQFGEDEWHVLSLVDGRRSVTDVAAESNLPDIEACLVLCKLLDRGIVRASARKEKEATPRRLEKSPAVAVLNVYNELLAQVGYAVKEGAGHVGVAQLNAAMSDFCDRDSRFFKSAWLETRGNLDAEIVLANLIEEDPEDRDEALAAAAFSLFRYELSLTTTLINRPSQAALVGDLQPLAALLLKNYDAQLLNLGVRRAINGFLSPTDVAYGAATG